jgi:hypothetical protein
VLVIVIIEAKENLYEVRPREILHEIECKVIGKNLWFLVYKPNKFYRKIFLEIEFQNSYGLFFAKNDLIIIINSSTNKSKSKNK